MENQSEEEQLPSDILLAIRSNLTTAASQHVTNLITENQVDYQNHSTVLNAVPAVGGNIGSIANMTDSIKSIKEHVGLSDTKSKILGNYFVGKVIGEGSFAKVRLATHRLTNQKVALKIIDKTHLPDEYSIKNLYRESTIMKKLRHPHIIRMLEIIETKKECCLVLEYAAGGEVLDFIVARGRLKENEARKFFVQLLSALEYCHKNGIVHRDLKAENFLLDSKLNLKISDFGLSNFFKKDGLLHTCCGSPVYSAPELIEGKTYIGPEIDFWSLGINLYAMVVGDLPFAHNNVNSLYKAILKAKYEVPEFISFDCKDLISKLLVVNPKKRFNAQQIREHPWYKEGSVNSLNAKMEEKLDSGVSDQINNEIVEQMLQMGIDRESIMDSVQNDKFNQVAGIYNCMQLQKLQGNQETHTDQEEPKTIPIKNEKIVLIKRVQVEDTFPTNPHRIPIASRRRSSSVGRSPERRLSKMKTKQDSFFPSILIEELTLLKTSETTSKAPSSNLNLPHLNGLPKVCNTPFAFNCQTTSTLPVDKIAQQIRECLVKLGIKFTNISTTFNCEMNFIKFEIDICRLSKLEMSGLRFKRLAGDIWEYKALCSKIGAELKI